MRIIRKIRNIDVLQKRIYNFPEKAINIVKVALLFTKLKTVFLTKYFTIIEPILKNFTTSKAKKRKYISLDSHKKSENYNF